MKNEIDSLPDDGISSNKRWLSVVTVNTRVPSHRLSMTTCSHFADMRLSPHVLKRRGLGRGTPREE